MKNEILKIFNNILYVGGKKDIIKSTTIQLIKILLKNLFLSHLMSANL
jgi:hypothetical protein